jgi:hypothetical protein
MVGRTCTHCWSLRTRCGNTIGSAGSSRTRAHSLRRRAVRRRARLIVLGADVWIGRPYRCRRRSRTARPSKDRTCRSVRDDRRSPGPIVPMLAPMRRRVHRAEPIVPRGDWTRRTRGTPRQDRPRGISREPLPRSAALDERRSASPSSGSSPSVEVSSTGGDISPARLLLRSAARRFAPSVRSAGSRQGSAALRVIARMLLISL